MIQFFPATGSEAEWNTAYYRLEDYLRALRVVNKVYQSQVILRIVERAAVKHAKDPSLNPTELAMDEARWEMSKWFEGMLGARERLEITGLISMLAIDAPAKWPVAFLSEEVPVELVQEMRESDVQAGPDLQVSSMVPRPIDVTPLLESLNFSEAWENFKWGPATVAVLVLAALSVSLILMTK